MDSTANPERSLAEATTPVDVVDTTPPSVDPQDFDVEAFILGVRPTRRSVQLFPQAHLIARLEEIAAQIDSAADDADVDGFVDEFDQVRGQFQAGVWFTVEKRSSEWVERFREITEKRLGLRRQQSGDDAGGLSTADLTTVTLHQLAEQVVVPEHVTYAQLRSLLERNEGELNKLLAAMIAVNNELAQRSQVLTRDFSGRRSTRSAT